VVLIGAGFIGCIILEALVARGVELTVVETGDRMVPRMMNATAGGMIKAWCEHKGVTVFTDTSVTGIEYHYPRREAGAPPPPRLEVSLNNGHDLRADLVISAAGVRANTDILQDTVVEIDRGILVSHYFRSSVPNIYAAGDACQGRDFSTGTFAVHAIQPTAVEHGRVAALNMAGRPTFYPGSFNMNILDTLGLISTSFGLWMGVDGGEQSELSDPQRYRYINLQFQDDVMVGATVLGHTQHVGVLRGLIQGKVRLGNWRDRLMADPTRVVEAYLARNAGAMTPGLV
jgi:NADPH-dependent 2,4-dienoyl-CoA reductase/sulfur reductase-like enzyme